MTPRSMIAVVILAAGSSAVVGNVAEFAALELETGDEYEAVRIKGGHDAVALVEGHFGSTQQRFLLYAQLRDVAPGARLVVAGRGFNQEEAVGLGLAEALVRSSGAPPTVDAATARRLDDAVVAEGEHRDLGPYAIAVEGGPVESVTLVVGPRRAYLADDRLLATSELGP